MLLNIRELVSDPPELIERFRRGIKFDIFVDGKVVPYSFHADTAAGLVKAYAPDEAGKLRVCTDHTCVGEYEVRGRVEIKRRPGPTAANRTPADVVVKGPQTGEDEIAGAKVKTVYGG